MRWLMPSTRSEVRSKNKMCDLEQSGLNSGVFPQTKKKATVLSGFRNITIFNSVIDY